MSVLPVANTQVVEQQVSHKKTVATERVSERTTGGTTLGEHMVRPRHSRTGSKHFVKHAIALRERLLDWHFVLLPEAYAKNEFVQCRSQRMNALKCHRRDCYRCKKL